jgi:hypothetical protein
LLSMTNRVVCQASRISNSLYARGHKDAGRKLNQLASLVGGWSIRAVRF